MMHFVPYRTLRMKGKRMTPRGIILCILSAAIALGISYAAGDLVGRVFP